MAPAVGLLALGLIGAACGGGAKTATTLPPLNTAITNPAAMAYTALTEAGRSSAHVVQTASGSGAAPQLVADLGAGVGTAAVGSGTDQVQLVLAGGVIYVKGPSAQAAGLLGLPPGKVAAQQWVAVMANEPPYASLERMLRLPNLVVQMVPTRAPFKISKPTHHGRVSVVAVTGTTVLGGHGPAKTRLVVEYRVPHLPLSGSVQYTLAGGTSTVATTFTDWGKPVTASAPTPTVAYATVAG